MQTNFHNSRMRVIQFACTHRRRASKIYHGLSSLKLYGNLFSSPYIWPSSVNILHQQIILLQLCNMRWSRPNLFRWPVQSGAESCDWLIWIKAWGCRHSSEIQVISTTWTVQTQSGKEGSLIPQALDVTKFSCN